ncbi:MAG: glycosyltransferase [Pseudomonadota bacterium]
MTTVSDTSRESETSVFDEADIVFLTGMHRSGTSFLAKRLHDTGLSFPGDLLPANADNPEGYWEAREVVRLNNRMLESIGSNWRDHGPISNVQMERLIESFSDEAGRILNDVRASAGQSCFAIKDPRLCRLLPVWQEAAISLGMRTKLIATIRAPSEVVQSLFRRTHIPKFAPAAVANPTKAILLWLRYNLDLDAHSQGKDYNLIDFEDLRDFSLSLLSTPRQILEKRPLSTVTPRGLSDFASLVHTALSSGETTLKQPLLEQARAYLLQPSNRCELDGPSFGKCGDQDFGPAPSNRPIRIGFLSGSPDSKGHIYRIENRIGSLIGENWITFRIEPDKHRIEDIVESCDVLFVFRKEMDSWLDQLYQACLERYVTVIFDIDDLVFDPDKMDPAYLRFLTKLEPAARSEWTERSLKYKEALQRAHAVFVPTAPLAESARTFNLNVFVVPNGLSEARVRQARTKTAPEGEGLVIGYASGTATHDRDFETVAPVLADILAGNSHVTLLVQGPVSGTGLDLLSAYEAQVRCVERVPFHDLPDALHAYDINIAPLERGNPFCEGKSELKYFEAALVSVPSVVSKTKSFEAAVQHGETSYLADNPEDWKQALQTLISNRELRLDMGARAQEHVLEAYAPPAQRKTFMQAIRDARNIKPDTQDRGQIAEAGFSLIEILVALAIASLISMLIFGSLQQQYRLIDRVQNASADTLDFHARSRLLSNVIANTVPAWPESEEDMFAGDAAAISGMTGEAIFGDQLSLQPYSVTLVEVAEIRIVTLQTNEGVWELGELPRDAELQYYGHDGQWYPQWPPELPEPKSLEEIAEQAAIGNLPALIRIFSETETISENWVFSVYSTDGLGLRSRDFVGPVGSDFE